MDNLWANYLEQVFPMFKIDEIIVYTDSFRYWFADGLLEYAQHNDIKASVTLLDELADETIIEIKHSLSIFNETTLLAGIFSKYNQALDEINLLFNPYVAPQGFEGYSFLSQYTYPDQFLVDALDYNYDSTVSNKERIKNHLKMKERVTISSSNDNYIEFVPQGSIAEYPHDLSNSNHVLFPSTEIVVEVDPTSVDGVVGINRSIGSYWKRGELVDPFGRVETPVKILIEEGRIIDIHGSSSYSRRLKTYLDSIETEDRLINQIGFGIGKFKDPTGFIEVDRLSNNTVTFGLSDNKIEWNLGPITIE